ncbi:MAG TPA: 2'-5' RNA ligase family protein [Tepidisphaeraceae bacterium]|nr:2'-5' RNA ligase family protein [Tepidisphaeraceae bacterium]
MDCFPNRGSVRIVAAIFGGSDTALAGVHAAVEQRCQYLGFEREQRKYTPHATIARARPILPPATRELVRRQTQSMVPGPTFAVSEFVLMQSLLKPTGSQYIPLAHFTL